MPIKFYKTKDPHGYMSNFYRSRIFLNGKWWNTVEHYYQAMKTVFVDEQEMVRFAKTPRIARELGQTVTFRDHFDKDKYHVMKDAVLAKFVQHRELREQLLATNDEVLIEDSPVDYYWGCGADGTGQNMLGKVLMEVRTELRRE
ncbi:MAG: NADAR family protein [Candidatus Paceibacterota bacterium]